VDFEEQAGGHGEELAMSGLAQAWGACKEAIAALERVLARASEEVSERRQEQLLAALNVLELAVLALPDVEPDGDDIEQPPHTYEARRTSVDTAFPEFGFYSTADMRNVGAPQPVLVGDAVGDLADILADIDRGLWHETHSGVNNAVWEIRQAYETHFGAHLADLRAYLYRLRFAGP
jgi:hypothetical protein